MYDTLFPAGFCALDSIAFNIAWKWVVEWNGVNQHAEYETLIIMDVWILYSLGNKVHLLISRAVKTYQPGGRRR